MRWADQSMLERRWAEAPERIVPSPWRSLLLAAAIADSASCGPRRARWIPASGERPCETQCAPQRFRVLQRAGLHHRLEVLEVDRERPLVDRREDGPHRPEYATGFERHEPVETSPSVKPDEVDRDADLERKARDAPHRKPPIGLEFGEFHLVLGRPSAECPNDGASP